MELKTYFAQDASGNIMPGATVTVYEAGTATLATGLQDESGSPLANPFTADSSAKVAFYAPDGLYDITVVGNGRTVTIRAQFVSVDGASVLRADLAAPGGSALVGYDGGTAQDVLDDAKPMANYTALRAYSGRAMGVRITQPGLAGFFWRDASDTTSPDNGGTVIVDASGRRWKRLFTGTVNAAWFGAKGDWDGSTGTDNHAPLQAAIDFAFSFKLNFVELPSGRLRITKPLYLYGSDNYIRTGVSLRGAGVEATSIVKTGNGTTGDGSWYAAIDACVILTPYPAPVSATPVTGTYNVGLYDLTVEGAAGTANTFGVYTKDDFGKIKTERICIIGQDTTFRTDGNMWLSSFENLSMHPVKNGFWMNKSGTSVSLKNAYVLGGGAGGGVGFNLQSLYSHADSVACEGFLGTQFLFRFAGWTVNGLGVESASAVGRAIAVANSSTVIVNSALVLCPNGVEVAAGCSLKLSGPQFGDEFTPITRSGSLWFVAGDGALCIENMRKYDTFSTANTGYALVNELSGIKPFKSVGVEVNAITSDTAQSAIIATNGAGQQLFQVRNDGVFWTGMAAASPYNNTSAAPANIGVDSSGILFRSTSSIRYKRNVQDAAHGLADVLKLRPVTYEGVTDGDAGKRVGGLIAEEVHEACLTEFVVYDSDGNPDALAYANMVSLLVKAIQELKSEFDEYKASH